MTATLPCRCGVEGGTTRSSVRNSVLQRLVTHIIRLRVGVLVSERGPRLIVINGVTDGGRKMAHRAQATEKGRHSFPDLEHLEELRRGGRDRLYDVSAADPPNRSAWPMDSPALGSIRGGAAYPIPRLERPEALSSGHARLARFGAAASSSRVTPVKRECSVPGARFLIVDDCKLNRENLAAIFVAHGGSEPTVAWDLPSLCAALGEIAPEIVLFNMGTRDNMTLLRQVRARCPEAKMIVVGISEDDESEIVACAEAGVAGYHLRAESLDDLLTLTTRVANGESSCSPKVSAILLRRLSTLAAQRRPEVKELVLTEREIQILRLLESGLSNRQIANRLCIALHTVKNHVHSVLSKLGVSTRGQAAAYSRSTRYPELAIEI
jgi:DNA-binding NarL/FixJ family response regulator